MEKLGQLESVCLHIEEIEGLTKIEKLQDNENEEIYCKVVNIIKKFFSDEVREEESLRPERNNKQHTLNSSESKLASNTNLSVANSTSTKFFF